MVVDTHICSCTTRYLAREQSGPGRMFSSFICLKIFFETGLGQVIAKLSNWCLYRKGLASKLVPSPFRHTSLHESSRHTKSILEPDVRPFATVWGKLFIDVHRGHPSDDLRSTLCTA
jgi:hypothetical protein